MRSFVAFAAIFTAIQSVPTSACTLCGGDPRGRRTLREDLVEADAVVVGELGPARLLNEDGEGRTALVVQSVLKGRFLEPGQHFQIERYLPTSDQSERRGIFLFRRNRHRWELTGIRNLRSDGASVYVQELTRMINKGHRPTTEFFVRQLDHPDADVASDAFLEVARAADTEVAAAARSIAPQRLRRLLLDPATPADRRGLIAFLLACGREPSDLQLIQRMVRDVPADHPGTRRGLLAAYIVLQPKEGWEHTLQTLADQRTGFLERHAAFDVLLFMKNWQPETYRPNILLGMRAAIVSGDLADLAIEELRRWKWWDLTEVILEAYHWPTHDSPIVRRAILRYAVGCPVAAAAKFVENVRKEDPELVREITEALRDETNDR